MSRVAPLPDLPVVEPLPLPSEARLEENLATLGPANAEVADRIRAAPYPEAGRLEFLATREGAWSACYDGRALASRHRPLEEASRLADGVDVLGHPALVIHGFGLGHHVAELARRGGEETILVVFEPDLSLLRAVFASIDHRGWLAGAQIVLVDDEEDVAGLSRRLENAGPMVVTGTEVVLHPSSRSRLGRRSAAFDRAFVEIVAALHTTMLTTLVHSTTSCRNLALNLDHYALGPGVEPLRGVAAGAPAILVAAGPSLHRALPRLADPRLRDRAVIVAVQTVLRPLLERGIRPHFVTALDYHEISRQFYEGLDEADLAEVTLVCDPKANRAIVEGWPGPVRCIGNTFLDRLLGPASRPVGRLRPGATVAHLSLYLAQHLGCDPIVLAGQDLAFTDNLYYGPGASIHALWAPELGRFNTIEMMEWRRVARMKRILARIEAADGTSVLTDQQMRTYLQQFERDFRDADQEIIDATGAGAAKRHTTPRDFDEVADEILERPPLASIPIGPTVLDPDPERRSAVRHRLEEVHRGVRRLGRLARVTGRLVDRMQRDIDRPARMDRHFDRLEAFRAEAQRLAPMQRLVDTLNQTGVFNRYKHDRSIRLAADDPRERQRRELERDAENLRWLGDASEELVAILDESRTILDGGRVDPRISRRRAAAAIALPVATPAEPPARAGKVLAVVRLDEDAIRAGALDPLEGAGASPEDDAATLPLVAWTIRRLRRSERLDAIVLAGSDDALARYRALVPATLRDVPDVIEEPIVPDAAEASRRARLRVATAWSRDCWRGGIGGMTAWDEWIDPRLLHRIVERHDADAVVPVHASTPLVAIDAEHGIDALAARRSESPEVHRLVFTPAVPGLGACLLDRRQVEELADHTGREATIGAILDYRPTVAQQDPITKDLCVKPPLAQRTIPMAPRGDEPRGRRLLAAFAAETGPDWIAASPDAIAAWIGRRWRTFWARGRVDALPLDRPRDVEIELLGADDLRFDPRRIDSLFEEWPGEAADSGTLTLRASGPVSPLDHPDLGEIVVRARRAGVAAIHLRTPLERDDDPDRLAPLLDDGIDVLSIPLPADTPETYARVTGRDDFAGVMARLEGVIERRATGGGGNLDAVPRPWIVPVVPRLGTNRADVRTFVDRWRHLLGAWMIEAADARAAAADPVIEPDPPRLALERAWLERLLVGADGRARAGLRFDRPDAAALADLEPGLLDRIGSAPLSDIWRTALAVRRAWHERLFPGGTGDREEGAS